MSIIVKCVEFVHFHVKNKPKNVNRQNIPISGTKNIYSFVNLDVIMKLYVQLLVIKLKQHPQYYLYCLNRMYLDSKRSVKVLYIAVLQHLMMTLTFFSDCRHTQM